MKLFAEKCVLQNKKGMGKLGVTVSIENLRFLLKPSEMALFRKEKKSFKRRTKGWNIRQKRKFFFMQSLEKIFYRKREAIEKRRYRIRLLCRKYFEKWLNFCGYEKRWISHGCNCNRVWVVCANNCREEEYIWTKK